MAKVISENGGDFDYHFPRLVTIVTAQDKGKENAMTVGFHQPVSFNPPIYAVSIAPKRFTYQLIAGSKEFGVNFLSFEQAERAASVGGSGGREINKFQQFSIEKDKSVKTSVPILKDAYAAYECKLIDDREYGDHRLLIGEVVAVHWLKEAFTSDGALNLDKISPMLYLGHELYLSAAKDTIRHLDRKVYGKR